MKETDTKSIVEDIIAIAISILGILAIKSLLNDDSSEIVSDRGKNVLNDEEKMREIEEHIQQSKESSEGNSDSIYVIK